MAATKFNLRQLKGVEVVLAQETNFTHTGTTAETTVKTYTVPGGSLGANGYLHWEVLFSWPSSANSKTFRVKVNGTEVSRNAQTTSTSYRIHQRLVNRNATNAQVAGGPTATSGWGFGASGVAVSTYTFDTTADLTITLTGELASSSETITWDSFTL